MYVKVFKQTLDSSLMEASTDARLLFFYLLVMADNEGVVDMTPHALARRCNMDLEAVQRGLKELAEPDPMSRTPVKDGRRIIPLEGRSWGWTVVNLGKYREIRSEQDRRKHSRQEYQARYYQQRKAKADAAPAAPEDRDSTVENVESVEFQQPQHFQHDSTLSTNSTVERVENVENVESQHSQQVSTFSTPKNKNKNKKKNRKKRESRAREVDLLFEDPRLRGAKAQSHPPPHVARQWLEKLGSRENLVSFLVDLQERGKLRRWSYVNTIVMEDGRREESSGARPIFLDRYLAEMRSRAS